MPIKPVMGKSAEHKFSPETRYLNRAVRDITLPVRLSSAKLHSSVLNKVLYDVDSSAVI